MIVIWDCRAKFTYHTNQQNVLYVFIKILWENNIASINLLFKSLTTVSALQLLEVKLKGIWFDYLLALWVERECDCKRIKIILYTKIGDLLSLVYSIRQNSSNDDVIKWWDGVSHGEVIRMNQCSGCKSVYAMKGLRKTHTLSMTNVLRKKNECLLLFEICVVLHD